MAGQILGSTRVQEATGTGRKERGAYRKGKGISLNRVVRAIIDLRWYVVNTNGDVRPVPPPLFSHPLSPRSTSLLFLSSFFTLLSPSPPTFPLRTSPWFIIPTGLRCLSSTSLLSFVYLLGVRTLDFVSLDSSVVQTVCPYQTRVHLSSLGEVYSILCVSTILCHPPLEIAEVGERCWKRVCCLGGVLRSRHWSLMFIFDFSDMPVL